MISKKAVVQVGLGIALIGGIGSGITVLQLNQKDKFDATIAEKQGGDIHDEVEIQTSLT